MIKARKTLLNCYGRGKYACLPHVGGHGRKPSQHAVRYPTNTFRSSSVCTRFVLVFEQKPLVSRDVRITHIDGALQTAVVQQVYSIYSKPGCYGYLAKWGNCSNSPLLASFPLRQVLGSRSTLKSMSNPVIIYHYITYLKYITKPWYYIYKKSDVQPIVLMSPNDNLHLNYSL